MSLKSEIIFRDTLWIKMNHASKVCLNHRELKTTIKTPTKCNRDKLRHLSVRNLFLPIILSEEDKEDERGRSKSFSVHFEQSCRCWWSEPAQINTDSGQFRPEKTE